ncbi:MAG TPA: hypothetical protein VHR66_11045 [Gemmataceae bacterium]|jgi:hypothetical protein|nr:hypothetical protein [Gemmataceae bacterium]
MFGFLLGVAASPDYRGVCRGLGWLVVKAEDAYAEARRAVAQLAEDVEDAMAEARACRRPADPIAASPSH